MAATVTTLETRRSGKRSGNEQKTAKAGGPTVRASITAFLDTPKVIRGDRHRADRTVGRCEAST